MVRIIVCNLVHAEADFLTGDDPCPLSGNFSDKWKGSLSQQMSKCYTAVFTAKVVQVGTEEVQASSEKSACENSLSFQWNHTEVVGGKPQGTSSTVDSPLSCISGLCIVSVWSKSSPLAFVGTLRFEAYCCISVLSVPFICRQPIWQGQTLNLNKYWTSLQSWRRLHLASFP